MKFTWDQIKDAENFRKHSIHFAMAIYVFDDPFRITRRDDDSSGHEERRQTIGVAD